MSPEKEIRCGDRPYLTTVPAPPLPGLQDDANRRDASAVIMAVAEDRAAFLPVRALLEQQNFPALFNFARNNEELQLAMNAGDCDIVLIDLPARSPNLPEVIDSIRLRMPAVPVILLADRADEASARGLLTSGVREYVLKDGLDRLVPAIDRSLRTSFLRLRAAAAGKVPAQSAGFPVARTIDRPDSFVARVPSSAAEQKQPGQNLRESDAGFRSLAEQPFVGACIIQDDAVKYANQRFAEMFGYRPDEIADRSLQDLIAPEDRQRIEACVRRCLSRREPAVHEAFTGPKRTGGALNAELFGVRAEYLGRPAVIGTVQDVTAKRSLEEQLRQAQKMETAGRLASCIAHDFNNILSTIVGYASLLAQKTNPDDAARGFAEQILAGAEQAAKLVRSLLGFSRKQTADFRVIDVNEVIERAAKLIRVIIGAGIDLRVSTAARLLVNADPCQIEQVLMNLATNAADAMPHGGSLSIETDVASGDPADPAAATMREHYALITVADTGTGMDERTRKRVFEPFFTTKDAERGTGLGLSIVSGIVQQHKGVVRCESRPGAGTRFRIYLPLLAFQRKPAEAGRKPAGLTADKMSAR